MNIKIKLFSYLRDEIACDEKGEIEMNVKNDILVEEVLLQLDFWQEKEMLVLLNGSTDKKARMKENDKLQIFPLVVGG
ncbi:MAG: hypothetical protein AB1Z23_11510 [Eubacteriales bacterium]